MADAFDLLADLRKYATDAGVADALLPLIEPLTTEVQGYKDQVDGATVQIQEKDRVISQSQEEISRLKSQNYDLVIAQPGKQPENQQPEQPEGIRGLFTSRRKH